MKSKSLREECASEIELSDLLQMLFRWDGRINERSWIKLPTIRICNPSAKSRHGCLACTGRFTRCWRLAREPTIGIPELVTVSLGVAACWRPSFPKSEPA